MASAPQSADNAALPQAPFCARRIATAYGPPWRGCLRSWRGISPPDLRNEPVRGNRSAPSPIDRDATCPPMIGWIGCRVAVQAANSQFKTLQSIGAMSQSATMRAAALAITLLSERRA